MTPAAKPQANSSDGETHLRRSAKVFGIGGSGSDVGGYDDIDTDEDEDGEGGVVEAGTEAGEGDGGDDDDDNNGDDDGDDDDGDDDVVKS